MLTTLLALFIAGPPQAGPDVVLEDYTVQPGDSCAKISRRRFGKSKLYSIIHEHNDLGPLPHDLEPGLVLRLPVSAPVQPDAELTRTERSVQARAPKDGAWSSALEGLDLFRGWRVNTLERAFAEVTFRDTTQIHLRENTLVIIYGGTRSTARRKTTTATLDRGALRSSLGALSGKAKLEVETPSSATSLTGGVALVTVDEAGTSRIANHGDGQASVRSKTKRRKRVRVRKGMGSKVEKGKEPTPPKPLPATPAWATGAPTVFVAPAGAGGRVAGSWGAIAGAKSYRVELGQDARGGFVSTSVAVPGTVSRFEAHNLEPGKYFAIVSAIDDDAFESIPSRMVHLELRAAQLVGVDGTPVTTAQAEPVGNVVPPVRTLLGTSLRAPDGLRCAFGDGELSTAPVAVKTGAQTVRCQDDSGADVRAFDVEVYGVQVALAGAAEGGPVVLKRSETRQLSVELSSPAGLPAGLAFEAPDGVAVSPVGAVEGGKATVTVTPGADAPSKGTLRLVAGTGDSRVVLGVVDFEVGDTPGAKRRAKAAAASEGGPDDPWIKRHGPTRNMVEIGAFGGAFIPHPRLELFEYTTERDDFGFRPFQPLSFMIGPRVSYAPLRFLALEVDGAYMPSSADRLRTTIWAARGQVLGQLGLWSTTPYVLAGVGALGVRSQPEHVGNDVDLTFHFGAGLKVYLSPRWMLRLEARDTLSPQRGVANGVAHSLEAHLGIGVTLNRPKRGR